MIPEQPDEASVKLLLGELVVLAVFPEPLPILIDNMDRLRAHSASSHERMWNDWMAKGITAHGICWRTGAYCVSKVLRETGYVVTDP